MKCDMNCAECTRPVEKCLGGPSRYTKSALPWRGTTKTTIGKGDPGLSRASCGRVKGPRQSGNLSDDRSQFTKGSG